MPRQPSALVPGDPSTVVRRYYDLVDEGDVSGLLDLFEPTAEYHRPGYGPLVNHSELAHFYRSERVIESGRHTITKIIEQDQEVAVHGTFEGVLRNGSDVSVDFADFFSVTPRGTFSMRRTFFYAPLV
ncbi:nuclear transport factor 2 family protein [Streptomyces sp. NPDC059605]|uniref:nuclear transport factor 2 family protein n=1 Tax=unclassified Streptomyces TaxID=2593676 RepID=UPI0033BEBFAF